MAEGSGKAWSLGNIRVKSRHQPPVRRAKAGRTRVILALLVVTGGLAWALYAA
jgi:hypothetical protein